MTDITKEIVLAALKRIAAPDGRGNIVSAGLVSEIAIFEGKVMFALNAEPQHLKSMEGLRAVVEKAVSELPGVNKVLVALTAEQQPARPVGPQGEFLAATAPRRSRREASRGGGFGQGRRGQIHHRH